MSGIVKLHSYATTVGTGDATQANVYVPSNSYIFMYTAQEGGWPLLPLFGGEGTSILNMSINENQNTRMKTAYLYVPQAKTADVVHVLSLQNHKRSAGYIILTNCGSTFNWATASNYGAGSFPSCTEHAQGLSLLIAGSRDTIAWGFTDCAQLFAITYASAYIVVATVETPLAGTSTAQITGLQADRDGIIFNPSPLPVGGAPLFF